MTIQLTVTDNPFQIMSGIPIDISMLTDIPSTIFFTLDGSTPTVNSNVYVGPISFPQELQSVTLQAFATNGADSSSIFSKLYAPNIVGIRQTRDQVLNNGLPQDLRQQAPFGAPSVSLPTQFGPTGLQVVDAPGIPNRFDGYDGTGTGTPKGGVDLPLMNYQILTPERDSRGDYINTDSLIQEGMINGKVTVIKTPQRPPETSRTSDKLFNPRALVIYQDARNPPDTSGIPIPQINKYFYSALDPQKTRDGSLETSAFDAQTLSGSFVRSEFNAAEGTVTFYYYDNQAQQWIISKEAYSAKPGLFNYSGMVFPSRPIDGKAARFVYKWPAFINRQGPI